MIFQKKETWMKDGVAKKIKAIFKDKKLLWGKN